MDPSHLIYKGHFEKHNFSILPSFTADDEDSGKASLVASFFGGGGGGAPAGRKLSSGSVKVSNIFIKLSLRIDPRSEARKWLRNQSRKGAAKKVP